MPPLGVLTGAIFIRAFAIWLTQKVDMAKNKEEKENEDTDDSDEKSEANEQIKPAKKLNILNIGIIYLASHLIGYMLMCSPQFMSEIGNFISNVI